MGLTNHLLTGMILQSSHLFFHRQRFCSLTDGLQTTTIRFQNTCRISTASETPSLIRGLSLQQPYVPRSWKISGWLAGFLPSTVRPTTSFIFLPSDLLLRCPYGPNVEVVVMQSHGMCPQIEGTKWAATFWGSFQWMVQWLGSSPPHL